MSRWTENEDLFLVEFFEVVGADVIAMCDLPDRSPRSIKSRVKKLKETGAWRQYELSEMHRFEALKLAGHIPKNQLSQMLARYKEQDFAWRNEDAKPQLVVS